MAEARGAGGGGAGLAWPRRVRTRTSRDRVEELEEADLRPASQRSHRPARAAREGRPQVGRPHRISLERRWRTTLGRDGGARLAERCSTGAAEAEPTAGWARISPRPLAQWTSDAGRTSSAAARNAAPRRAFSTQRLKPCRRARPGLDVDDLPAARGPHQRRLRDLAGRARVELDALCLEKPAPSITAPSRPMAPLDLARQGLEVHAVRLQRAHRQVRAGHLEVLLHGWLGGRCGGRLHGRRGGWCGRCGRDRGRCRHRGRRDRRRDRVRRRRPRAAPAVEARCPRRRRGATRARGSRGGEGARRRA